MDDAAVRERLAMCLVDTLNGAKDEEDLERRDALLDELRALRSSYVNDGSAREHLMMGLVNALADATEAEDVGRRNALRYELRGLGFDPDESD